MRVFITGIAGFLGSHLADKFLAEGWEVSGCDDLSGGKREYVPLAAKFYEADCLDREAMVKLLRGTDVVYHCAAAPYEGLSTVSPFYITQSCNLASVSVMSAAITAKVRRFIFCSSIARYGKGPIPFQEWRRAEPVDPYGIAKYASELTLRSLSEVHGLEYAIAVPHNIIGTRQRYDDPYRNVASIFINKMLRGEQPIIYGDGEQKRCFSFVSDVTAPFFALATTPVTLFQDSSHIFNVGPDDRLITINALAQILAGMLEFDLHPVYVKDRPQEVRFAFASADLARSDLGYNPKVHLEEGLREMVSWIKERGALPFRYDRPLEIQNAQTPETWTKRLI